MKEGEKGIRREVGEGEGDKGRRGEGGEGVEGEVI